MDHAYIESQQIADRYVAGTLPAEEMERFENHYLGCPECLDRLELAESLQRGFKRMAGQDAAVLATARQLAVVAWLARLGRSRQAAVLAMTVLVLVLLPVGFLRGRPSDSGQELAQVRAHLKQEQQRSAAEARRVTEAEKTLEAARRDLADQQEANARFREKLAEAQKPQNDFAVLQLAVVRDAGPEDESLTPLSLAASTSRVDVVLEIEESGSAYRVILQDARHRELWRAEGLRPDANQELTFALPANFLPPGAYAFRVEGKSATSRRFPFRVRRPS